LEFNVPFQHKYGYIRDEDRTGQRCDSIRRTVLQTVAQKRQIVLSGVYINYSCLTSLRGLLSKDVTAIAEMGNRLVTIDMRRKVGAVEPPVLERVVSPSNTTSLQAKVYLCTK